MFSLIKLFKKYFFKFLVLIIGMLVITMPFALFQMLYPHQAHSLSFILSHHPYFFISIRWIFIALLVGFWPMLIDYYAKKQQWSRERTHFWLSQRFRIAGWLIIFELLICENLLLILFKAL